MEKNKTLFSIITVALISSICFVGRLAFSSLPNIQPVTTIVILVTLIFGFKYGLAVSITTMFISNLYLGMGPWTLAQFAAYAGIVIITALLTHFLTRASTLINALFCLLMGYFFSFVISLVQAPFFGIKTFWVYYLQGLSFDTLHALGNFAFAIVLFPVLTPLFYKLKTKYFT